MTVTGRHQHIGGKSRLGGFSSRSSHQRATKGFHSHSPFPSRVLGLELVIGKRRPVELTYKEVKN